MLLWRRPLGKERRFHLPQPKAYLPWMGSNEVLAATRADDGQLSASPVGDAAMVASVGKSLGE